MGVSALVMRLRAELRARGRAWLVLALAIGVTGGLVVAVASTARRTEMAFDRHLQASVAADAYVDAGVGLGDTELDVARLAGLAPVSRAERTRLLAIISRARSGRPIFPVGPQAIQYQVASDDRAVNTIDRPLVIRGRLPDPDRHDEVLADPRALQILGIDVGDRFVVRLIDHDAITRHLDDLTMSVDPRSPQAARWGPLVGVRVVGVQAHAKPDIDGGYITFTPAFRRAHGDARIGAWTEELAVRLRGGHAGVPAFRAAVYRAARGHAYGFYDPATTRPTVERSLDLLVTALGLVTISGAIAAALLGVPALLRSAAVDARSTPILQALGLTAGRIVALAIARTALLALPATAALAATAVLLSPLAPVGWARELDPVHGVQPDVTATAIGALVLVTVMLAAGAVAGVQAARGQKGRSRARTSAATTMLSRTGLPPSAVVGMRMALSRGPARATVPVGLTLTSAVLAAVVLAVSMTFAQSVGHLLDTPRLYGQTWDFETYNAPADPAAVRAVLRDPTISDVSRAATAPVEIGSRVVGARALSELKGRIDPTVLDGRAPRGSDEALLGTRTLKALQRSIGDVVTVRRGRRGVRLRIVGRGVLPVDKWNEIGQGIALRLPALRLIAPAAPAEALLIRISPGVRRDLALSRLTRRFDFSVAVRPQEIGDFGRVRAAPALIVLAFAVGAAAALLHLLLLSVRRRRRDLAVLKTLGFTRRQVQAAIAWQASTVAAVGVLVGWPLGVAIGRFGWNVFAADAGVASEPVTPVGGTLVILPAAILLANLIAALPARAAAATRPAAELRAE
jgi:hypothetical protein